MAKASDNVFPKVILGMQTSNPSAPSDSSWKAFAKADGIYARSSNTVVGPFGAAGGSLTVQDEGTPLSTSATTLNFVGAGVTASGAGATKTITIPGGGSPTFVGARAVRTTAQTGIVTATLTAIAWNGTDVFDSDAFHDPASNNTKMIVPSGKDGKYLITARVQWDSNSTGIRLAALRVNGTTNIDEDERAAFGSPVDGITNGLSAIYSLAATDYVEVMVYQTSGGNRDTGGVASGMHFDITLLGT